MKKPNFKVDEIVLVLIVALIAVVASYNDSVKSQKGLEAEKITTLIFDDHALSFASNGIINESKLKEIQNMDYKELKNYFNANRDFCMYIIDGNGKIILAKGSDKLVKDKIACGR